MVDTITQLLSSPNLVRWILWLRPLTFFYSFITCFCITLPLFLSHLSSPLSSSLSILPFIASPLACLANFSTRLHPTQPPPSAHQTPQFLTPPSSLLQQPPLGTGGTHLVSPHGTLHGAHGLARKMVCCRCLGAPLNLPGLELSVRVCISFPPRLCCRGQ